MCIDTAQANGLSLNANTSSASINFHIAKTLIGKIVSTGLSITGNISFTGTLNSISTTVFAYLSGTTSNIQTQFGHILGGTTGFTGLRLTNKYLLSNMSLITAATVLTFPTNQFYSINSASAITITLPLINNLQNCGVTITFRRTITASVAISFTVSGGTQLIYNLANTSGNTMALLPSGSHCCTIASLYQSSISTYAWYQVA